MWTLTLVVQGGLTEFVCQVENLGCQSEREGKSLYIGAETLIPNRLEEIHH